MIRFLFGFEIRSEKSLLIERVNLIFGRLIVFAITWTYGHFLLVRWFWERIFIAFIWWGKINNIWPLIERFLDFFIWILFWGLWRVLTEISLFKASCFALILVFLFINGTKKLVTDVFITRFVCGIHEKLEFTFFILGIFFFRIIYRICFTYSFN